MDIVNHLRLHFVIATLALIGSIWLSRLIEVGIVQTLPGLAGIGGILFGCSIYVGLVYGVGAGIGVLILQDTIEDYVHRVKIRRQEVIRRTAGSHHFH